MPSGRAYTPSGFRNVHRLMTSLGYEDLQFIAQFSKKPKNLWYNMFNLE
jgi:hypothetical protein